MEGKFLERKRLSQNESGIGNKNNDKPEIRFWNKALLSRILIRKDFFNLIFKAFRTSVLEKE